MCRTSMLEQEWYRIMESPLEGSVSIEAILSRLRCSNIWHWHRQAFTRGPPQPVHGKLVHPVLQLRQPLDILGIENSRCCLAPLSRLCLITCRSMHHNLSLTPVNAVHVSEQQKRLTIYQLDHVSYAKGLMPRQARNKPADLFGCHRQNHLKQVLVQLGAARAHRGGQSRTPCLSWSR